MELVSKHDVKRICIDPINTYAMNIGDRVKLRQTIFNLVSLTGSIFCRCKSDPFLWIIVIFTIKLYVCMFVS